MSSTPVQIEGKSILHELRGLALRTEDGDKRNVLRTSADHIEESIRRLYLDPTSDHMRVLNADWVLGVKHLRSHSPVTA